MIARSTSCVAGLGALVLALCAAGASWAGPATTEVSLSFRLKNGSPEMARQIRSRLMGPLGPSVSVLLNSSPDVQVFDVQDNELEILVRVNVPPGAEDIAKKAILEEMQEAGGYIASRQAAPGKPAMPSEAIETAVASHLSHDLLNGRHGRVYDAGSSGGSGGEIVVQAVPEARIETTEVIVDQPIKTAQLLAVPEPAPASQKPQGKIVTGPFGKLIMEAVAKANKKHGTDLDPEYVQALMRVKSRFHSDAGFKNPAGDSFGLMGISHFVHKDIEDLRDPKKNIEIGVDYLATLWKIFARDGGADGAHRALAAYQLGKHRVYRSHGLPPEAKPLLEEVQKAACELDLRICRPGPIEPKTTKQAAVARVDEAIQFAVSKAEKERPVTFKSTPPPAQTPPETKVKAAATPKAAAKPRPREKKDVPSAPAQTRMSKHGFPLHTREAVKAMAREVAQMKGIGVNPTVFVSLVRDESRFNQDAVSPRGAKGPGQLLDGTFQSMGRLHGKAYPCLKDPKNIWEPKCNLIASGLYFRSLLDRYEGHDGKVAFALAAYNSGEGNQDKGLKHNRVVKIRETFNYVSSIAKQIMADGETELGKTIQQFLPKDWVSEERSTRSPSPAPAKRHKSEGGPQRFGGAMGYSRYAR